ncbi:MAG TPA: hypothetical protein VG889_16135 [Rhizomicrobium sp.]|nr:hypothetical protein [Rhizomicrobium sp.]
MALQLAVSLAGIALMVGLCRLLFGAGETTLSAGSLTARLARDVPGFRAGRIAIGRDARAALVENASDGAVWLALARGDGMVTRKLARATNVVRDGERLALLLNEFTLKRAELDLADAADWEARLRA